MSNDVHTFIVNSPNMKSKTYFIKIINLIIACFFSSATILTSCSEQVVDNVASREGIGERVPISFIVKEQQDSINGDATRAITYIGNDNFFDVVKQIKVSAFKEDGSVYINAATYRNSGERLPFVSDGSIYYWPEDGSKLKFFVWYGNGISVNDKGIVNYDVKKINDNEEDCLLYESDYVSPSNYVAATLHHTCAALSFKVGKYFHPQTAVFDGTSLDISNGRTILLPINDREFWLPYYDTAIPLPNDKREYVNIQGYWDQAEFSRNMNFYIPFSSFNNYNDQKPRGLSFSTMLRANKYNIEFDEMAPNLGYKADGTPNWITDIPIDLGLSVLWSRANLGVEESYPNGLLYAWAETESKGTDPKKFTKENYKFYDASSGKINLYRTNEYPYYKQGELDSYDLDDKDDPATKRLGKGWRLPTPSEFLELFDNDETFIQGSRITSKNNNNSIVLQIPINAIFSFYETSYRCSEERACHFRVQSNGRGIYARGETEHYVWDGNFVRPIYEYTTNISGVTIEDWKPSSK